MGVGSKINNLFIKKLGLNFSGVNWDPCMLLYNLFGLLVWCYYRRRDFEVLFPLSDVVVDKQAYKFCDSVTKPTPLLNDLGLFFPRVGTDGVSVSSREYFKM